jgi:hypothetical protein
MASITAFKLVSSKISNPFVGVTFEKKSKTGYNMTMIERTYLSQLYIVLIQLFLHDLLKDTQRQ